MVSIPRANDATLSLKTTVGNSHCDAPTQKNKNYSGNCFEAFKLKTSLDRLRNDLENLFENSIAVCSAIVKVQLSCLLWCTVCEHSTRCMQKVSNGRLEKSAALKHWALLHEMQSHENIEIKPLKVMRGLNWKGSLDHSNPSLLSFWLFLCCSCYSMLHGTLSASDWAAEIRNLYGFWQLFV